MGEESGADLVFSWLVFGESMDSSAGEEGGLDELFDCCDSLGIKRTCALGAKLTRRS